MPPKRSTNVAMLRVVPAILNRIARAPAAIFFGWFLAIFALERTLACFVPTTYEWDVLTRALIAWEMATKGLVDYVLIRRETVWLPGYMLVEAGLFRLTKANPVVLGEFVSAVSAGLIAGYVYLLGRLVGVTERQARQAPALLLVSGYALAYFSQGMTEAFATWLFAGALYHLLQARASGSRWHTFAAAAYLLVHAMTRWEGILYLALIPAALVVMNWRFFGKNWGALFSLIYKLCLPAGLFAGGWLLYARWARGNGLDGVNRVRDIVQQAPLSFVGNPFFSLGLGAMGLVATSGGLWLAIAPHLQPLLRPRGKEGPVTAEQHNLIFLALLGWLHVAWVCTFSYAGLLAGWPRHLLYVLPLTAVLFSAVKWENATKRRLLGLSIFCGIVAFAVNVGLHQVYLGGPEDILRVRWAPIIAVPR